MREIKFRGKTKDGEWVYGNYVLNPIDGKSFILSVHETTLEQDEIIPETLEQYTGLKDCNGVEIYEGDELEDCDGIVIADMFDIRDEDTSKLAIVGNIHDNPELLEARL